MTEHCGLKVDTEPMVLDFMDLCVSMCAFMMIIAAEFCSCKPSKLLHITKAAQMASQGVARGAGEYRRRL